MITALMRSGIRSNNAAGAAARSRLNRPQSCRKKSPSAARRQTLKAIAVTMGVPLSPRPATMQPHARRRVALVFALLAACGRATPIARIHASGGGGEGALEGGPAPGAQAGGLTERNAIT